jgi:hypothetical protein
MLLMMSMLASVPAAVLGQQRPKISVYKDPTCGCCANWVAHLRSHGFEPTATDVTDLAALKTKYGVAPSLRSCHTALVDGYVIEGHVPAADIQRLLKEKPKVLGLTVPGMPVGSPGMEGTNGQRYDVLTFDASGRTAVYSTQQPSARPQ